MAQCARSEDPADRPVGIDPAPAWPTAERAGQQPGEGPVVAVLCPEPRLRRILRLALQADGRVVVEWRAGLAPSGPPVALLVADLDSLRWPARCAIARLRQLGVAERTAVLLISVYPPDEGQFEGRGLLDYLQPPFGPRELAERAARLLARGGAPADGRAEPG